MLTVEMIVIFPKEEVQWSAVYHCCSVLCSFQLNADQRSSGAAEINQRVATNPAVENPSVLLHSYCTVSSFCCFLCQLHHSFRRRESWTAFMYYCAAFI